MGTAARAAPRGLAGSVWRDGAQAGCGQLEDVWGLTALPLHVACLNHAEWGQEGGCGRWRPPQIAVQGGVHATTSRGPPACSGGHTPPPHSHPLPPPADTTCACSSVRTSSRGACLAPLSRMPCWAPTLCRLSWVTTMLRNTWATTSASSALPPTRHGSWRSASWSCTRPTGEPQERTGWWRGRHETAGPHPMRCPATCPPLCLLAGE